jgi:2Fe-2S ferredoxin
VTFISADGSKHAVDANPGYTLMEAAIWNDVPGIDAECGGNCACATCHVFIAENWMDRVPPANDLERELLEALESCQPTSRLSCQIKIAPALDGLVVSVPDVQG